MLCMVLSPASCQHTMGMADDYCQLYNEVITAKGDGAIVATPGVKRRLLANELTYHKLCGPGA